MEKMYQHNKKNAYFLHLLIKISNAAKEKNVTQVQSLSVSEPFLFDSLTLMLNLYS